MARKINHERVMDSIFESWDWHIYQHLQSADNMIFKVNQEGGMFGVPDAYRQKYIREKIIDMLDQIAEQREGRLE